MMDKVEISFQPLLLGSNSHDHVNSQNLEGAQENGSTVRKTSAEQKEKAEQTPLTTNGAVRTPAGIAGDGSEGKGSRQNKDSQLVHQQIKALLIKRFHHASRSRKDFLAQVLLIPSSLTESSLKSPQH